MALPGLHSELACLQNLQDVLQKRLDLEREYTSSLAAWHTAAHKTGPQSTHALRVAFRSLIEGAENDIQARQSMEATFRTQIDRVLAAMEDLGGHFERITACSKKLEEFDELAREALENRKLRHEEWKTWKPKPVPSWRWSKPRNEPVPTGSTMASAYNLADRAVRQYVSKAEVARCSFKDEVIAQVDAISVAYQIVIDTITKCLRLFAEDQQQYARSASTGAAKIINVARDTSGSRLAGAFRESLAHEAQAIPTDSMPYNDLESSARDPTTHSQPIIFGFSLPPYYFSYTASSKLVVDVFYQLVSFGCDSQGWYHYLTQPPPTDYSLVPIFSELERSWKRDENLNRDLLESLGPSTCVQLVDALLASFPEPLIDCSELPAEHLRLWNPDPIRRPDTTWAVPSDQDGGTAPVPLVPRLYDRPQGEMLRALCVSLIPIFRGTSKFAQNRTCEIFSDLLTRKGGCIKHAIPNLVREFTTTITAIDMRNAPLQGTFDSLHRTTLTQPVFGLGLTPRPYDSSTISGIASHRNAIINMAKNKANAPHTILLVGGTSVGRPSLIGFIANTLLSRGDDYYNLFLLGQTRTVSPHLYEIASELGVLIRILDTPGFTSTHSVEHDDLLKQSIVTSVETHLNSVTAVLIQVDSIVFTSDSMHYTLSTLSTILPKTLANNIAFVFTNGSTPSLRGFSVPEVFKCAPIFVFEGEYFHRHRWTNSVSSQDEQRRVWRVGELSALKILAELFNWMNSLNPQPATEIANLFGNHQNIKAWVNNALTQMGQATAKKEKIDNLMTRLKENSADMDSFSNLEETVDMPVSKQQPTASRKIDKQVLVNQDMKKKWETAKDEKEKTAALIVVNEMVLHDVKQAISRATNNLASLVEQYTDLSLTGSFSVQIKSAVKFLEQKYIVMEKTGVGLEKVKECLDQIKKKLEPLDNTKENEQPESVGIAK